MVRALGWLLLAGVSACQSGAGGPVLGALVESEDGQARFWGRGSCADMEAEAWRKARADSARTVEVMGYAEGDPRNDPASVRPARVVVAGAGDDCVLVADLVDGMQRLPDGAIRFQTAPDAYIVLSGSEFDRAFTPAAR